MDKLFLEIEYNRLINRLKKADSYFENDNISLEAKTTDKIINGYNDLIKDISRLQNEYKKLHSKEMPDNIKYNGFK